MKITKDTKVIIIGQHLTSRTEAVRDYLLNRVGSISIIGLGSFAVNEKANHAFYYENGVLKRHYIFNHKILERLKLRQPIILFTFFIYCIDIIRSLIIFRWKFDVSIGISNFPGLIGVILKSIGICKRCIYYSIDYYAPHRQEDYGDPHKGFNRFERTLIRISNYFDKLAAMHSDEVWNISPRIEEGRLRFSGRGGEISRDKNKIVPLGYSQTFFRNRTIHNINRYSIVFVGVVLESQGLELMLEVLPALSSIMPDINVKIIGTGPFLSRFKSMVYSRQLQSYFTFYGFIKDVEKMLDIVASSAVGISIWDDKNNRILNAYYGDPGKTKLYSVCGLPVVVSDITVYSQIVMQNKAGIAIKYNSDELFNSLEEILLNDKDYAKYKANVASVANEYCDSEKIFNNVLNSK